MAKGSIKKILRYAALPELKPRIQDLLYTGFRHVSFYMALVYQTVRLLPANHPYANPANIGAFGIRHVIAEAANNLVMKRENIDQIILFFMVLLGMALILVELMMLGVGLLIQPVMAQVSMPTNFTGFFVTEEPGQDLAYMFMDLVFGIPGMFESCVADAALNCQDLNGQEVLRTSERVNWADDDGWILSKLGWPHPIHNAMHTMFQAYSIGLLVVAMIIGLYFVVTIIVETAQTGTPFGKRFNKVWAPIRIVVAFGLLIPIGHGLNSSQYIVLYAAKFGSSFATNGWTLFNDSLMQTTAKNYLSALSSGRPGSNDANSSMISTPNPPDVGAVMQFLFTAMTCQITEAELYGRKVRLYMVGDPISASNVREIEDVDFGVGHTDNTTYKQALEFINGGSQIIIRVGEHDKSAYPSEMGNVSPICGELVLSLSDPRRKNNANNRPDEGSYIMQEAYFNFIKEFWGDLFNRDYAVAIYKHGFDIEDKATFPMPETQFIAATGEWFQKNFVEPQIKDAVTAQVGAAKWTVDQQLIKRGWGGAGIFYNRVAELNGVLTSAVLNTPVVTKYPIVMEHVLAEKAARDAKIAPGTRFQPKSSGSGDIGTMGEENLKQALAYWWAFRYWQEAGGTSSTHSAASGNAFNDMVTALFGTSGLYSLRRNEGVHPLAMLTGVGRSLIESAVKNIGLSMAAATTGAAFSFLDIVQGGQVSEVAVGLFMTFAMIGLIAGFILFYVVPFMPFIYFFFALGGWIKGIFEAMVGAPLWALAHIRIDKDGLPGPAAMNGYLLIFEIFLRPILIVFGMLASILTFSALVDVLNDTWDLVTGNLTGFDIDTELAAGNNGQTIANFMRGPIDEFFFTVIYAVIVYLMGLSSFKMIDLVPNNILRWMGASVQSFNDMNENPAEGLASKAGVGGQQVVSEVGGGVEGLLKQAANYNKGGG